MSHLGLARNSSLGFSPQAYYKWRANPVSQRDWDDAHLINAAWDIHHDDPAFGYRFIADELPARGITTRGRGYVAAARLARWGCQPAMTSRLS